MDSKWERRKHLLDERFMDVGITQVQNSLSVLLLLEGGSMSSQDVPEPLDWSKILV